MQNKTVARRSSLVARQSSIIFLWVVCCLIFFSQSVFAFSELRIPNPESRIPDPGSIHESLDRSQKYSKKFQSEFGIFGGDYLGDEWRNTWDVGAHYYLHLNNTFAVGASYMYSPIDAGNSTSFGQSLKTDTTHTADGEVMIINECAFRAGSAIIDCELFFTIGGGAMWINNYWKPVAVLGGGMKIYTPSPYVAIRVDVNSLLHYTPIPSGDNFNADMVVSGGISLMFPAHRIKPSK